MAITLIRQNNRQDGLYPLKPSRDLRGVADLIELAFAGEMDEKSWRALRDMRMTARFGFLIGWLDLFSPDVNTNLNGFVWLTEGRVVGNVNITRQGPETRQWFISNVAVSPELRGLGIARQLMNAAVEFAKEMRGRSVSLQVRRDNDPAIHIYKTMGFKARTATTFLRIERPHRVSQPTLGAGLRMRGHRLSLYDAKISYQLARSSISMEEQEENPLYQSQFQIGSELHFYNFWRRLFGYGEIGYWFIENEQGRCVATLSVEPAYKIKEHTFSFLVHPSYQGQLEASLVAFAMNKLAQYPDYPIAIRHRDEDQTGIKAMTLAGLTIQKTHVRMKLWL